MCARLPSTDACANALFVCAFREEGRAGLVGGVDEADVRRAASESGADVEGVLGAVCRGRPKELR